MRKLFLIVLFSFLMVIPFVSAIPDPPALIWFTGNENPPFDNDGIFTVNWDPVTNEDIIRYNIYPIDAPSGQVLFVGSNTTATTYIFSNYAAGNFTFNVTAVNAFGEEGPVTPSDWVYVKTTDPTITFVSPTPENNAHIKTNWTTISISVVDAFLDSVILNWNGVDMLFNDPSGTIRAYPPEMQSEGEYAYYVWANDSAKNSIKSETRYVTYDATPPSITVNSPIAGASYYNLTIPIEYTVTDSSPLTCWYEYNSVNTTLTDCKKAELTLVFNNQSNITIWVRDAAENINFKVVSFSANPPKPPVIVSTIPENGKIIDAPSISGKTMETISIKTDKVAQCKYSTIPNTLFEVMQYGFADVGSNVQNATIPITDKTSYSFYIRCMSTDAAVALNDYVLQFSTAAPGDLLILDPDGVVLKNNKFKIEAIRGQTTSVNLPVKTRALYDVTGFTATISGDASPFMAVNIPVIKSSGTSNITVSVMPNGAGTLTANITLSFGGFSSTIPVEITTYEDISLDLGVVETALGNLSASIEELKSKGRNVDDLSAELNRIASEIALVRSIHDGGNYVEARKLFIPLSESFDALKENLVNAESNRLENNNNPDANGSTSGIGGISLTTIVIVIIIVIVLIIIATSVVSDKSNDDKGTASDASSKTPSENQENYGF